MSVRVWIPRLTVVAIVASLISLSAGAQSPNFYSSVIMTDILSGSPIVGGTFTTDIQVSVVNNASPTIGIEGVEIWLPFDAGVVTVDDHDDNPANGVQVEIRRGFFDGNLLVGANDVYVGETADPTTSFEPIPTTAPLDCTSRPTGAPAAEEYGCVHVAVSHTGGSGPVTNRSGSVATIRWGGIKRGDPQFAVSLVGSQLVDTNGSPQTINSVVVPQIPIRGGGGISGVVLLQGRATGAYGNTAVNGYAPSGEWELDYTDADGTFFLSPLTASSITVHATRPGYLRSQKGSIYLAGGNVNIGTTTLIGGDTNSDNCINILDIVSIISCFGREPSACPATVAVDINGSGTVNIQDLTLAAGNFARCGPTTWAQ